ncbi:metal ABC transporter substrate-binding protein [Spirochaetia bacterium]|nr:metal ABC transporter substrate-binding protein [Spirochaetia bacterium]
MKKALVLNRGFMAFLVSALIAAALTGTVSCSKKAPSAEKTVIKVGVTSDNFILWDSVQAELDARGKAIKIEPVVFDGGATINSSTANGELDANAFQHYAFFNQDIKDKKLEDKLTVAGETLIVPLSLFVNKDKGYTKTADLPDGASIAIPDDPTNQGRALSLLVSAGLITIREEAGHNGFLADITGNPRNFKFVELYGPQIPRALPDVDAAVINCGIAVDAGLDPINDPTFKIDIDPANPALKPFINIIVTNTKGKDSQAIKDFVDAYRSKRVAETILEVYRKAAVPVFDY